ncbi:MAG: pyruvate, phosphate dikinase [Spirochaetaceae bacterium]|nr:MAG: pyruvate, phosphate dikinase [Spirochaetaceae bacterium]
MLKNYSERPRESTGMPTLDRVLDGLRAGDNVVWRLDSIAYYVPFAEAFLEYAKSRSRTVVYFRFGGHAPVLPKDDAVIIQHNDPELGFENFITQIHRTIRDVGIGGYYVFDALSDLSDTCYSDRMIGNFFQLTCPYLLSLDTIAYFALYRHRHSYHAAVPIYETTQVLLDVYCYDNRYYLQPAKVFGRKDASPLSVFRWDEERFSLVNDSAEISAVMESSPWGGLRSASYRMVGLWDKTFMRAETVMDAIEAGELPPDRSGASFRELVRLVIPREERMINLATRYLTLHDLLIIWKRMIGTGMIGGKSIGMLLARAILRKERPDLAARLEAHDSFFIGSDVFYTFLVNNRCWWDRQRQKDPQVFLTGLEDVRQKILSGTFPDYIVRRFEDMLEYFGHAPIIVRSSSLLEDNFGNAFSGKYDSVFCANQGTPEQRLKNLLDAIRTVYASTMSEEALAYRRRRNVLERDEQMALLVQRVSGSVYGDFFFPQLAGVTYSFNPYVWSREIDPHAGVLRLVFGLGTRAVDRWDDDYTRVIALNAPDRRPESSFDAVKQHTQRRVDVIDLRRNQPRGIHFQDLVKECSSLPLTFVATRDRQAERDARDQGMRPRPRWILTFDPVFETSNIVNDLREIVRTVREGYGTEVDIEFTANMCSDGSYSIDIVQCRPFHASAEEEEPLDPIPELTDGQILIRSTGGVIGHGRQIALDRIIYVSPEAYTRLTESRRYALARLIGRITKHQEPSAHEIMMIGPGRWGSSTAALGIPVSFGDINNVAVLMEVDALHEGLVPDLSLGTHFFNDMVEMNMLYVAHFLARPENRLDRSFLENAPSSLLKLFPDAADWEQVVRVIDTPGGCEIVLQADAVEQTCVVYTSP